MSDTSTPILAINLDLNLGDYLHCERFHSNIYFISSLIVGVVLILTGATVGGFLTSPLRFLLFLAIGLCVGIVEPVRRLSCVGYMWFRGYLPKQMTVTVSDTGLVYTIGADYRVTSEWSQVGVYETDVYFFLWSGTYAKALLCRGSNFGIYRCTKQKSRTGILSWYGCGAQELLRGVTTRPAGGGRTPPASYK